MSTYAGGEVGDTPSGGGGGTAAASAVFAAGMAECEQRQGHMHEPMGGAESYQAESTQQPTVSDKPGNVT